MKRRSGEHWVAAAAAIEAVTGLVLIVRPSLPARLLFGAELSDAGQALGRFIGIALISFAFACMPGRPGRLFAHAGLQHADHRLSCVCGGGWRAHGHSAVAGSCSSWSSDDHPHSRLAKQLTMKLFRE